MIRIISLDTETTGLSVRNGDRIIEIGCVEIINNEIKNKYQRYFKVNKRISYSAYKVHGINNYFLKDKKIFRYYYKDIINFIKNSTIISHNASFDIKFLKNEFNIINKNFPNNKFIDTLELARKKFPGKKNNLRSLLKRFNIKDTRKQHSAINDALNLAKVFILMNIKKNKISNNNNNNNIKNTNKIKDLIKVKNRSHKIIMLSNKYISIDKKFIEKVEIS